VTAAIEDAQRIPIFARPIRTTEDWLAAQQSLRDATGRLEVESYEQTRLGTATAELIREVGVPAATPLELELAAVLTADDHVTGLEISLVVPEPVGARLREALARGSAGSPSGIVAARRLVDRVSFRGDGASHGVVMRIGVEPATARAVTPGRLREVARALADGPIADRSTSSAEVEGLRRELAQRDEMIRALRGELEDTNRGVLSLYAELDERAEYLRRAADLKTRILSDMGHELRTPIHSILTIAQFLLHRLDGELSDEQDKQVRIIRNTARDLSQFIDDLLDLAKAQAGKVPVRAGTFAVGQLFNTLRGIFRPRAQDGSVQLVFDEPPEMATLVTDESKLSQILRNFIANALKFTREGEVRVSAMTGEGDVVVFSVSDTGIGVAPEYLEYIFEEFTQIDGPMQRASKGTGLGLPLARRLTSLLGGEVSVQSTLGKGSTFTAKIPRIFSGVVESDPADVGSSPVAKAPAPALHRAVIVDDDEAARYVLRRRLGEGFSAVEVSSGRTGLEAIRAMRPDVVFLDLRMPGMSGFDVLGAMGAEAELAEIPVIVMTSQPLSDPERERLTPARAILDKARISEERDSTLPEALARAGIPGRGGVES
jgi:signal transduction histidine kinase/CheY-like chemotaxis protein